jgi:hypothetical protein
MFFVILWLLMAWPGLARGGPCDQGKKKARKWLVARVIAGLRRT